MTKVIEFETVSPLFEMERDGVAPFTFRQVDYHDPRFRALAQWRLGCTWLIKITNPATSEYFYRKLVSVDYVRWVNWDIAQDPSRAFLERLQVFEDWRILVLGEIVKER